MWTTKPDDVPGFVARERASLLIVDVGSAGGAAWRAAHALQAVPELSSTAVLLPSVPNPPGDDSEGLDLGHIPIVALTAHALTADRARGGQIGFASYFTKPIEPRRVIEEIERVSLGLVRTRGAQ